MKHILSYVVTTRNKLGSLKHVLSRLIQERKLDEEIVVIDGASSDGTREYLVDLRDSGQIHQLISEPDKGEAHGYNKGFLTARGDLIKVITDDDVFHYSGIASCRDFMTSHPEIDVLATDGFDTSWTRDQPFVPYSRSQEYQNWLSVHTPFDFSGLGLMIRRASLPLTGLFNTGFVMVDQEYALRVTSGPANLAWYTGRTWVRILNAKSNAVNHRKRVALEILRLKQFYLGNTAALEQQVEILTRPAKQLVLRTLISSKPKYLDETSSSRLAEVFGQSENQLNAAAHNEPGSFCWKH